MILASQALLLTITESAASSVMNSTYWHTHVCRLCGVLYRHLHRYRRLDHRQFPYQCANKQCVWYFKNQPGYPWNKTRSHVVQYRERKGL